MSSSAPLRGSVAIIAMGETEVGSLPTQGSTEICAEAARLALVDAGITKADVDGLITCNPWVEPHLYHAEMFSEYMQIFPRFCMTLNAGGATTLTAVLRAASAIVTGVCETVLITHGDNPRTGMTGKETGQKMTTTMNPQFELPFGVPLTNGYAMAGRAHMHEFGTTSEQLAQVAVSARKHACLNPAAEMQTPLSIDDVLNSRVVADPLHALDCSLWSDGGGAVIVVAAERAKDFPNKPVYFLGCGEAHWHEHFFQARSLTTTAASESGPRAFEMAGLGPRDMDFAQVYDCFTPVVLMELEDLGFCPKGEGGSFVENGNIELGSDMPVNTHGGLLSHSHTGHPGSMFALTEAVTQLRGTGEARQVAGAEVGLVHGQGGVLSSHATLILGSEATL
jgi:acetyl-CoA acetyltransferase